MLAGLLAHVQAAKGEGFYLYYGIFTFVAFLTIQGAVLESANIFSVLLLQENNLPRTRYWLGASYGFLAGAIVGAILEFIAKRRS